MPNLERFIDAQKRNYTRAQEEIKNGRKASDWIWYILPQVATLGYSYNAKYYGILDFNEACEYLNNPDLFNPYDEIVTEIEKNLIKKPTPLLAHLMNGEGDAHKLVSSLTLFRAAAAHLEALPGEKQRSFRALKERCDRIFTIIAKQGYSPCTTTLSYLPSLDLEPKKEQRPINHNTLFSTPLNTPEPLQIHPIEQTEERVTVEPVSSHVSSPLLPYLQDYIQTRPNEWSYHYNFLGIAAFTYFLLDALLGTDYFHIKNSETKIGAATKLMHLLDPQYIGSIEPFTATEQAALEEGRLGNKVAEHGGLQHLIQNAPDHQLVEPGPEMKLKS